MECTFTRLCLSNASAIFTRGCPASSLSNSFDSHQDPAAALCPILQIRKMRRKEVKELSHLCRGSRVHIQSIHSRDTAIKGCSIWWCLVGMRGWGVGVTACAHSRRPRINTYSYTSYPFGAIAAISAGVI